MNSVLIVLLIFAALAYFWLDSMKSRERAIQAARTACRQINVQLLDQTVSLQSIKPARNKSGSLTFRRIYEFDYTADGYERHHGRAILLGQMLEQMQLDDERGVIIEAKEEQD